MVLDERCKAALYREGEGGVKLMSISKVGV